MKSHSIRLSTAAVAALLLSSCASQTQRAEGDTNPFCLLLGAAAGGGTAAAVGAAAGPIGAGVVAGAMLGGLLCPKPPPVQAVAAAPTVAQTPAPPPPRPTPADPDSDGDGVADRNDRCPDTPPGTRVGADGCPDILLTLTGVNFKFDRAEIEPKAATILSEAAEALDGNPAVDVHIEGHTDSVGSDAYNLRLSQRRADAVRDYLVRQGIAASRLTTLGVGEARPVMPNDTAEGRFQNRRVEFHVERGEAGGGATSKR